MVKTCHDDIHFLHELGSHACAWHVCASVPVHVYDYIFALKVCWLPLQAGQAAASKLLSPVLGCLTARYPMDQFAPTPTDPTAGSASGSASDTSPQGVSVESWLGSKAQGSHARQHAPKWHQPNSQETQFAEELMQTFLVGAASQLQEISQASAQGGKYPKETIQGLLIQIEGAHHGLRSALPDFTSANLLHPTGQKLALVGSAALGIGGPEIRDGTAKSLIAAAGFIGANDYETLGILLRVMSGMLSRGAHEFQEAMDSFSSWKSDQDVAFDPPLAALLFGQVCSVDASSSSHSLCFALVSYEASRNDRRLSERWAMAKSLRHLLHHQ